MNVWKRVRSRDARGSVHHQYSVPMWPGGDSSYKIHQTPRLMHLSLRQCISFRFHRRTRKV